MTDLSLEAGRGRWVTRLHIHDYVADALVALRGSKELCFDLMDDPEGVRLACDHIAGFYSAIYEDLYNRIASDGQPICNAAELGLGKTG